MKPWITAAGLGLVLAYAGPWVLGVFQGGADHWGVLEAAVAASLWTLMPSLLLGWIWSRVGKGENRYRPVLAAVLSTLVLLVLVVRGVHHRWLWEVGFLLVVPLVVCGVPLVSLLLITALGGGKKGR